MCTVIIIAELKIAKCNLIILANISRNTVLNDSTSFGLNESVSIVSNLVSMYMPLFPHYIRAPIMLPHLVYLCLVLSLLLVPSRKSVGNQ